MSHLLSQIFKVRTEKQVFDELNGDHDDTHSAFVIRNRGVGGGGGGADNSFNDPINIAFILSSSSISLTSSSNNLGSASTKDSMSNVKVMPRFRERFDYVNDSHVDMMEETEKFILQLGRAFLREIKLKLTKDGAGTS